MRSILRLLRLGVQKEGQNEICKVIFFPFLVLYCVSYLAIAENDYPSSIGEVKSAFRQAKRPSINHFRLDRAYECRSYLSYGGKSGVSNYWNTSIMFSEVNSEIRLFRNAIEMGMDGGRIYGLSGEKLSTQVIPFQLVAFSPACGTADILRISSNGDLIIKESALSSGNFIFCPGN